MLRIGSGSKPLVLTHRGTGAIPRPDNSAQAALEDPMMTFGQGLPRPTAVTPTAAPAAVPAMVGPGPVAKAAEAAYAAVRKSRAPAVGTPELWHVHVGDEITIARLIHQQLCNGPRERGGRDVRLGRSGRDGPGGRFGGGGEKKDMATLNEEVDQAFAQLRADEERLRNCLRMLSWLQLRKLVSEPREANVEEHSVKIKYGKADALSSMLKAAAATREAARTTLRRLVAVSGIGIGGGPGGGDAGVELRTLRKTQLLNRCATQGIAKRMLERFPVGSEASEAIPSLESLLRELDRLEHQEAKAAGKGRTGPAVVLGSKPQLHRPRDDGAPRTAAPSWSQRGRPKPSGGGSSSRAKEGGVFAGLFREEALPCAPCANAAAHPAENANAAARSTSTARGPRGPPNSAAGQPRKAAEEAAARPVAAVKLGERARLGGLHGFLSELNGRPCVLEGSDPETGQGYVRLVGGFVETVPLENVLPE
ncbi:unnamed protein product [Durusdinium trenchii]|uniref:Uncharacterized protein n=1 Tax=Durusdinium trenchii TaxID=1381693 RepID=A0ABP0RES7_9DINO